MSSLITAPWQVDLDGLLLGPGTPYGLTVVEGLREMPGIRAGETPRARGHGSHGGRDDADPRIVRIEVDVAATPTVGFADAVAALSQRLVVRSVEVPVWAHLPGWAGPRRLDARVRRGLVLTDVGYEFGLASATVHLVALDPLLYGQDRAPTTGLPVPGGGLAYPLAYPLSYGAPANPGRVQLRNEGNADTAPRLTVTGELPAGFEVTVTQTGERIRYPAPLAAGEPLVLDCGTGAVLLQGTADRRADLTVADWFLVPAGQERTVQLSSLGAYSTTASLTVQYAPAWWA